MKLKLTPSFIAFVAFDIVLVIVLVIMIWPEAELKESDRTTQPGAAPTTPAPNETGSNPRTTINLMPINNIDPMTGKPVAYGCPTVQYKGKVIGFCCEKSSAFKGGWNRMSEVDKDAFVARFAR